MVSPDLLAILVCPYCKSKLALYKDAWLICQNPECHRKYPIRQDIPVMLIEEGDKYREVLEGQLPIPP
ncbi:MAG: Trm112 family protein [Chloroflexi bacterium]|nr:Trm112 family protein [Chloroflexota bacterium]